MKSLAFAVMTVIPERRALIAISTSIRQSALPNLLVIILGGQRQNTSPSVEHLLRSYSSVMETASVTKSIASWIGSSAFNVCAGASLLRRAST